jgi:hypothetical protein
MKVCFTGSRPQERDDMGGVSQRAKQFAAPAVLAALTLVGAPVAHAFGDLGHETVAVIARTQLTPQAAAAADRLLALDQNAFKMADGGMTSDSWERQATWADYFRNTQRKAGLTLPQQIHTYTWHFVDIEIDGGSLDKACFGFRRPVPGTLASDGPDPDCVVNKIEQFAAELGSNTVPDAEKLLALKFLMHFVGDIHQPLHATDRFDFGGNAETAVVGTKKAALHAHWDTTFVQMIGAPADGISTDPHAVAAALRQPSTIEAAQWLGAPDPRSWALESYALGGSNVYAPLPAPTASGAASVYVLSDAYTKSATLLTADQLLRAGYRLAAILNAAFAR